MSTDQENKSRIVELEERVGELTRTNGILKANISTLYRTAKAEIARKNVRISDLQLELDNLIFKRMDMKQYMNNNSQFSRQSSQQQEPQPQEDQDFSNQEDHAELTG